MGADGGVVYVPLKRPTHENYTLVLALLSPFWQFLSQDGGAHWAEDANSEWERENSHVNAPEYLFGYYGTDRCDNFELGDLEELTEADDELDPLTFDELDLDCRTCTPPPSRSYDEKPFRRLWKEHFGWRTREQTLIELGPLTNVTIASWREQMLSLVHVDRAVHEETWT